MSLYAKRLSTRGAACREGRFTPLELGRFYLIAIEFGLKFADEKVGEHLEIAHERPTKVRKRRGNVLFKPEMTDPRKSITENQGKWNKTSVLHRGCVNGCENSKESARHMKPSRNTIRVLREIKRPELLEALITLARGLGNEWSHEESMAQKYCIQNTVPHPGYR